MTLTNKLRALAVGESFIVPGKTQDQVRHIITTAKRGGKWFTAQTLTVGTRIRRYE